VTGVKPWEDPRPISEASKDRPILAWCKGENRWIVIRWWAGSMCWARPEGGGEVFPSVFYDIPPERKS